MKKITILMAMLALMMFSAVPAFAQSGSSIEVGEGDVTITESLGIFDSIVQSCPASVTFGDENVNVQVVENAQNADIDIDGNENEVSVDQSLSQTGFSPSVSTSCTQSVAQAFSFFYPWW
jgi:type III secretion system FlhB-like substrate exporter